MVEKRLITKEDLLKIKWPSNPVFSPDGHFVAFEEKRVKVKQDDYETQLWLADVAGNTSKILTTNGLNNHFPVWSPDGKILAFLSSREYGTQIWTLRLDGGEAVRLTRFQHPISRFCWSKDGAYIVATVPIPDDSELAVIPLDLTAEEASEARDKEKLDWLNHPKRYDWLYYKEDGGGLQQKSHKQLVRIDVGSRVSTCLTTGAYDVTAFAISPDSNHVAFVSNRHPNPEIELANHLYRVPMSGGEIESLCEDSNVEDVSYSRDGSSIAFFGHRDEYSFSTHLKLYTVDAAGGPSTCWTEEFPDTLDNTGMSDMRSHTELPGPLWGPNGDTLYALSSREGRSEVVQFTRRGEGTSMRVEATIVIGGNREIYGLSFDGQSRFAMTYTTPAQPGRVAVVDIGVDVGPGVGAVDVVPSEARHRIVRSLTDAIPTDSVAMFPVHEVSLRDANETLLSEIITVEPETFVYSSVDSWQVQGFLLRPANYEPGKKYPVILEVHGGPHAMYSYSYFHEMQWFAANGYAVVYVNPRGSMGYGQAFVNAVRMDYGGKDAEDILRGLDAALAKFDFLDASRVALTGGSYGGFMTNWLVTHTHRFFAAVSQRSISNWISFYGVSDIGPMFTERHIGGDVMNDFDKLWRHSPLAYVKNVQTPLLLIHSEDDLRCPIEQAEQFYTCIKRQGGEVELLRVPHANHDLSRTGKPTLRLARLTAMLDFINQHLPNVVNEGK